MEELIRMKRSILLSLLVIGAVAAMVSGASFSVFSDTESASGTVTAGTVQVDLTPTGTGSLVWSGAGCPSPLGSGDTCTANVAVNYAGNLAATFAMTLGAVESEPGCYTVSGTWDPDPPGGSTTPLPIASTAAADGTVAITVTLSGPNSCQGDTVDVTLTVTATET
jgi:predicted ribosomally synthesized peptide with SipW-like signal peptide